MNRTLKKILGVALSVGMIAALAPMSVFAMNANDTAKGYKVESSLKVHKILGRVPKSVSGKIDVSKTITSTKPVLDEDNQYTGKIICEVESSDLFDGAYKLYDSEIRGKGTPRWENIVMFSEGGNFPAAQFTVQLPDNFSLNGDIVADSSQTKTISSIKTNYDKESNTIKVTFDLGNWNDYRGFFQLVESEHNELGHLIKIAIPYKVDANSVDGDSLGTVMGSGKCELYKTTGMFKGKIVDINILGGQLPIMIK